MEQIKKKMASLREERDSAMERADDMEKEKKSQQERADAVSIHVVY